MPPSRPRRRGTPAEPPRAPFRAQEDYSCHVDAPRPKPRRNQAREPQNRSTPASRRRGALLRRCSAAAPSALAQIRPIRNGHTRLEPKSIRYRPLDLDPTAWIQTYRFGLALFLKRPSAFPYSTHSLPLVKSICSLVQNLASSTLSFLNIVPAVQLGSSCALALRYFWFLHLGPWF